MNVNEVSKEVRERKEKALKMLKELGIDVPDKFRSYYGLILYVNSLILANTMIASAIKEIINECASKDSLMAEVFMDQYRKCIERADKLYEILRVLSF